MVMKEVITKIISRLINVLNLWHSAFADCCMPWCQEWGLMVPVGGCWWPPRLYYFPPFPSNLSPPDVQVAWCQEWGLMVAVGGCWWPPWLYHFPPFPSNLSSQMCRLPIKTSLNRDKGPRPMPSRCSQVNWGSSFSLCRKGTIAQLLSATIPTHLN